MIDDHKILYGGSRNTLTYILRTIFEPPDHKQCRPSLLGTSCCVNGNVLHQTLSPPHGVSALCIWVVNVIPSLISLSFPETRPLSDIQLPTPNIAFSFSHLWNSPGMNFSGSREHTARTSISPLSGPLVARMAIRPPCTSSMNIRRKILLLVVYSLGMP